MRSFFSTLCMLVALLPALTLARPATRTSRCATNSECLKRGLPLLSPRTKRAVHPRVAYQTITGNIQYPGMSNQYTSTTTTGGFYQTLTGFSAQDLQVSLQIPLGATTVQTGLQVLINSPLSLGTYLALGVYPTTNDGSSISSSSTSYALLLGANSTTAPGSAPVNTISNTGGASFYLETDVWSYNPQTYELTAVWNNGQDSVPLSFVFTNGAGPVLMGDYAAYSGQPGSATSTAKLVQETD